MIGDDHTEDHREPPPLSTSQEAVFFSVFRRQPTHRVAPHNVPSVLSRINVIPPPNTIEENSTPSRTT